MNSSIKTDKNLFRSLKNIAANLMVILGVLCIPMSGITWICGNHEFAIYLLLWAVVAAQTAEAKKSEQ